MTKSILPPVSTARNIAAMLFGGAVSTVFANMASTCANTVKNDRTVRRGKNMKAMHRIQKNTALALCIFLWAGASCTLAQTSWWPAEGNANDVTDGNHGTLINGVSFASGAVGEGFLLDGVDDYVSVSPALNLWPGAGSFTIEAWIRTTATKSQVILSRSDRGPIGDPGSYIELVVAGGRLLAELRDADGGGSTPSGIQFLSGNGYVADGLFHHVALVRDIGANSMSLYLDGRVDASAMLGAGASGPILDTHGAIDPFLIGAVNTYAGFPVEVTGYFSGVIDEVKYWDRVMPVPEPAAYALFTLGGLALLTARNRRYPRKERKSKAPGTFVLPPSASPPPCAIHV